MNPRDYKRIFEPDEGSLHQIVVFDATRTHWQRLLDYLSSRYVLGYTEDGEPTELPDADTIFLRKGIRSPALEIMLPGFTVNCHFFTDHDIDMNVRPEALKYTITDYLSRHHHGRFLGEDPLEMRAQALRQVSWDPKFRSGK